MKDDPSHKLDYATPESRAPVGSVWGRPIAAAAALVLTIGIIGWVLGRNAHRPTQAKDVIFCASKLRQLGQALSLHARNDGVFPERLEQLLLGGDITAPVLVCPSSDEHPADTGATVQETLANVYREPGHCSYTYLGAGKNTSSTSPQTVIAYEPLGHHPPELSHRVDGANVLFADGVVVYVSANDFMNLKQEIDAGANSPSIAERLHDSGAK